MVLCERWADCFGGDASACVWLAVGFVPGAKVVKAAEKVADAADTVHDVGRAYRVNSFVPGTRVLMADGSSKPIGKVEVGDEVLATDPATGKTGARKVVGTVTSQGRKDLVRLTVDTDGAAGDRTAVVVATASHPFWVDELGRWVDTGDLAVGEEVHGSDGSPVEVVGVGEGTEYRRVHNLTIEGIHTYYVLAGDTPLLVHNNGCGDWEFISGVVRDAYKGKGNFGLGSSTRSQASEAGRAWVGEGYKTASDGKTMVSADGLRQYRPPSYKLRLGITQANFEQRFVSRGQWQSNGHLDIVD